MNEHALLTPEQIRDRINGLEAWVAHITETVDEVNDLLVKIADAGAKADERIADLAEAQIKTEETLQSYLDSITGTNGK
jgi:uncharacterized coiled-coil protein SlyX